MDLDKCFLLETRLHESIHAVNGVIDIRVCVVEPSCGLLVMVSTFDNEQDSP